MTPATAIVVFTVTALWLTAGWPYAVAAGVGGVVAYQLARAAAARLPSRPSSVKERDRRAQP